MDAIIAGKKLGHQAMEQKGAKFSNLSRMMGGESLLIILALAL